MKAKITPFVKLLLLLVLVCLSFLFAMFQGGFVSWFLFAGFLPFALYACILMLFPFRMVKIKRMFHQQEYKVGDEIIVEITIERSNKWPLLYLVIEDVVPSAFLRDGLNPSKKLLFFVFRQSITYSYRVLVTMRGEHVFQGIILTTGDILGFYRKTETFTNQDYLLVYPSYKMIDKLQLTSMFEVGKHTSALRSHQVDSIVSGVRHYMPGDGLSRIHWKATAKKQEMMTKDFEELKSQDVVIILEQSQSPVFEPMITFVASLSRALLLQGSRVGFLGSHHINEPLIIGKGERQRRKIFYQLAQLKEEQSVATSFTKLVGMGGNTVFIVVVSQLSEELLSSLRIVKGIGAVTIFIMKNESGIEMTEDGSIEANSRGIACQMLSVTEWTSIEEEEM